jgi:hypothetical protein
MISPTPTSAAMTMRQGSVRHLTTASYAAFVGCRHVMYQFAGGDWEDPDSFIYRDKDGTRTVDKLAAHEVWKERRAELTAEAQSRGLIPFAARAFEGMYGRVSIWEDLRIDGCEPACRATAAIRFAETRHDLAQWGQGRAGDLSRPNRDRMPRGLGIASS